MKSLLCILLFGVLGQCQSFQFSRASTSPRLGQGPNAPSCSRFVVGSPLYSSTLGEEELDELAPPEKASRTNDDTWIQNIINGVPFIELFRREGYKKLPPMQVEDPNLLFYDVFLLVNLTLSVSFWVTHRMSFEYLPYALNEGCLFSIFWIGSGLYHGSFLMGAVDGHYGSVDERGGPKAAAALALNTFISAANLRLVFALLVAVVQHRQVGIDSGEQLLPLEIGFGLLLMTSWRWLHSSTTPRI